MVLVIILATKLVLAWGKMHVWHPTQLPFGHGLQEVKEGKSVVSSVRSQAVPVPLLPIKVLRMNYEFIQLTRQRSKKY
jgi:hypothetical protein